MTYIQLIKPGLIGIAMVALLAGTAQAESQLGAGTPQNPQSEGSHVSTQAQIDAKMRGGHFAYGAGDMYWVGPYKDTRVAEVTSNRAAIAGLARQDAHGHWSYGAGDMFWVPGTAQLAEKKK